MTDEISSATCAVAALSRVASVLTAAERLATPAFLAPIRFTTARLPLQSSLVGWLSQLPQMDHHSGATTTRHFWRL
jgi:hypothetical protein